MIGSGQPKIKDVHKESFVKLNFELNKEKVDLHHQVVNGCYERINLVRKRHPLLPPDPNQYFKEKLCELQMQVLDRSKKIAELQSRLTVALMNSPDSVTTLNPLREVLDTVDGTNKKLPNNYGYGQDVLNIAWTTIDSVKNLVNKLPTEEHDTRCTKGGKVTRSMSEQHDRRGQRDREHELEKCRARSLNSCHPKERSRDIRALSNLDMNDGGLP